MENRKLFKKLDHLRPRIEQLKTYIELLENRFPLPLYVKLPDGSHKITRHLADNMQVEGISTKRGIYLLQPIHPSTFAKQGTTVLDLLIEAQKVHPNARPLISDDIFGTVGDVIADLLDTESKMSLTFDMLSKRGVDFWNAFPKFGYLKDNFSPTNTTMILYDLAGGVCDELIFRYFDTIYLFVPAKEIDTRNLVSEQEEKVEVVNKVSSVLPEGNKKFPLSLFLRDQKGEYRVSNTLMDGYTVEGIALRDTIILRQTLKPKDINKENPTVEDLNTLAKNVHPMAEPIYWKGFWGGGLVTLLMVDRKHYNQTAEMLRKHGVIMPNINGDIPFVGAALKSVDGLNDRVSFVYFNHWIGASTIASVKEVILAIPREKVDPLY